MNMGQIELTFSDTVNLTTFDPTGIVLQAFENATEYNNSDNILRLEGGEKMEIRRWTFYNCAIVSR